MIDFACKKLNIEEVIKCSLTLSKSDFRLLKFLMKNNDSFSTDVLAEKLGIDKSTVQRSAKKLHGKGLITRGQVNQSVGGYLFTYRVNDKSKIRKIILDIVDSWSENVKKRIVSW